MMNPTERTKRLFTTFCSTQDFAVRWANLGIISRLGIGSLVFGILTILSKNFSKASRGRQVCVRHYWTQTRLRHLILFWASLAGTALPPSAECIVHSIKAANSSCL